MANVNTCATILLLSHDKLVKLTNQGYGLFKLTLARVRRRSDAGVNLKWS